MATVSRIGSEKPKRILIVEDDPNPRRVLEDSLRSKYEIESAEDSQTALRLLKERPRYDLALPDLRIPAKAGGTSSIEEVWPLLEVLKKSQIDFFVLSAYLNKEILQRVKDFGAVQIFAKPFSQEALLKAVDAHLNPEDPPLLLQQESTEMLLARARERGRSAQAYLLTAEGGTLSKDAVAQLLHLSLEQVEEGWRAGRLIGLCSEQDREVYPAWQFDANGLLPGLEDVLADLRDHDPWMQANFFLSGDIRLNHETPLAELKRGHIEAVRRAARAYGEQCAA